MPEFEETGTVRTRRVVRGEGMLQCVRDFRYAGEKFKRGKSRVAPEWLSDKLELLRFFAPCDGSTRETYQRMLRRGQQGKPGRGTLPAGMLPARGGTGGERWRI